MRILSLILASLFAHAALAAGTNLPANPPPQAAAAGFTQLVYALDGASQDPISSWLTCTDGSVTSTTPYWYGSMTAATGTTCAAVVTHHRDPLTGANTLDLHWPGKTAGFLSLNTTPTAGDHTHEFAVGSYVEIKARGPVPGLTVRGNFPGPALFRWHNGPWQKLPNGGYGPVYGPIEVDAPELYQAYPGSGDFAMHDWGWCCAGLATVSGVAGTNTLTATNVSGFVQAGNGMILDYGDSTAPAGYLQSINGSTWTLSQKLTQNFVNKVVNVGWGMNGYGGGELQLIPGFDFQKVHSYGSLQTTDGTSYVNECTFVDGQLTPSPNGAGNVNNYNCGMMNFVREAFHYTTTSKLNWWIGTPGNPNPTDWYIYYIAVWTKPGCYPNGTDKTCAGPLGPNVVESR